MKAEYLTPTKEKDFARYILDAQSPEEQRLLSILRDLALREDKDVVIVIDGAEWVDKNIPGLPDRPVTRLCIHLEHRDGRPFKPNPRKPYDPQRFTREESTSEKADMVGRASHGGKMRVQHNPGQNTIVEIK